jgi:hypothetical protein
MCVHLQDIALSQVKDKIFAMLLDQLESHPPIESLMVSCECIQQGLSASQASKILETQSEFKQIPMIDPKSSAYIGLVDSSNIKTDQNSNTLCGHKAGIGLPVGSSLPFALMNLLDKDTQWVLPVLHPTDKSVMGILTRQAISSWLLSLESR